MAYRFLLEVPETLANEGNMAVGAASDAQVVVVRNSHGLGVDDLYMDLTVAAHSLLVIDSLYDWFDELGASRPDIRIVLHSGDRLSLEAVTRAQMVAAIRRDQPWVERTIPMIGEHEQETFADDPRNAGDEVALTSVPSQAATMLLDRTWNTVQAVAIAERKVDVRGLNHIALAVTDLAKAEQFYHQFLSMDIVTRARRTERGYETLPSDYTWAEANRLGQPADITFLRNGPVVLAVHRLGLGARMERAVLDHISLRVDATSFMNLKGQVLMRSMELIDSAETAFAFRDPFFVTWEITLQNLPEFMV